MKRFWYDETKPAITSIAGRFIDKMRLETRVGGVLFSPTMHIEEDLSVDGPSEQMQVTIDETSAKPDLSSPKKKITDVERRRRAKARMQRQRKQTRESILAMLTTPDLKPKTLFAEAKRATSKEAKGGRREFLAEEKVAIIIAFRRWVVAHGSEELFYKRFDISQQQIRHWTLRWDVKQVLEQLRANARPEGR